MKMSKPEQDVLKIYFLKSCEDSQTKSKKDQAIQNTTPNRTSSSWVLVSWKSMDL